MFVQAYDDKAKRNNLNQLIDVMAILTFQNYPLYRPQIKKDTMERGQGNRIAEGLIIIVI